jgi:endo-beta-N-acetylglucosaminidase D
MKLSLDPTDSAVRNVTPESTALAAWYDSHPEVRSLWAIKNAQGLRVIVRLEPTPDSDDTLPGWIANSRAWAKELQLRTHESVQLEAIDELLIDGIEVSDGIIVAALGWRDPTVI